jgi:hypothetical protein
MLPGNVVRRGFLLTAAFSLIIAVSGEAASLFIPAQQWHDEIVTFVQRPENITFQLTERLLVRLRIGCFLLGAASVACLVFHARLVSALEVWFPRLAADAGALWSDLRARLREVPLRYHLVLLAIMAAGAAVRFAYINQPMRCDESVTWLDFASRSLLISLSSYPDPNNHVFHTVLVWLTAGVLGPQPWAIRLPAFLAGVTAIPATFYVMSSFYDLDVGLLAAALVASSSFLVEFSTNARGYTMVCLATLILLGLGRYLRTRANTAAAVLLVLVASFGAWTIPVMLYPFAALMAWILLSWMAGEVTLPARWVVAGLIGVCVATGLLTVTLYSPIIVTRGVGAIARNQYVTGLSWHEFAHQWRDIVRGFAAMVARDVPRPLIWILGAATALGAVLYSKASRDRIPLYIPLVATFAALSLAQRVVPFLRVWTFVIPMLAGLTASGLMLALRLTVARTKVTGWAAPALACMLAGWIGLTVVRSQAVYYSLETGTLTDAAAVTEALERYHQPGDVVLANYASFGIEFTNWQRAVRVPVYYDPVKELSQARRIWLLVNDDYDQLDALRSRAEQEQKQLSEPKLVTAFPHAQLYEMRRLGSDGSSTTP